MSSVKAIADFVDDELLEGTKPNPVTPYGKSKLAAENYILSKEIPSTKKVFILRPCMIHGPGNKGNLNLLFSLVSKGIPYPFGKYKNKRSFVSIDNLCFIIEKLLEKEELKSDIFNVSDDLPLSTNEVVGIISKTLKKKNKIINVPKSIMQKIAKVGNYVPIFINEERVEKLTENYVVSNKKIKKALEIENLPVTSIQGLKKTISSFIN
jgi:nucleoside-diphosphate-sugar epimerase